MKFNCLIDLHLHLDGSLSLKSIKELAKISNIDLPSDEEVLDMIRVTKDNCKNLNDYLSKFALPTKLLQSKEALEVATFNLCEELKNQGLIYAEIRFAPQLHTQKGLSQEDIIEAVLKGKNKSTFNSNIILCCMRSGNNIKENYETVELAKKYLGKGVVALDLAGAEGVYRTEGYDELFAKAKELGVPFTIHAGEADGPNSVEDAVSFGASRIGHGVRSLEKKSTVKMLVEKKIPLEICPTSNVDTCTISSYDVYPFRELLDAGLVVTVNTDDMMVSNITLNDEFNKLIDKFKLSTAEIKKLLLNSADAAFLCEEKKNELKNIINNEI